METERFAAIWRAVSRWDAVPAVRIPVADAGVLQRLTESLAEFAGGREVLADSPRLSPRPARFFAADVARLVELHRGGLEFVAVRDGDPAGYWAVTEEEYEWQVYKHAEPIAAPDRGGM